MTSVTGVRLAQVGGFCVLLGFVPASGNEIHSYEPREYTFAFQGLRSELTRAEAVICGKVLVSAPDSAIGIGPSSRVWQREHLLVRITTVLKGDRSQFRDTLPIGADYSRLEYEGRELEDNTNQFFFYGVPTSRDDELVLLLRRDGEKWDLIRALAADPRTVVAYLKASEERPRPASRSLIRMHLDYFTTGWPDPRCDLVLRDDIERLRSDDPGQDDAWKKEVRARSEAMVRLADNAGDDFVELARLLREEDRRRCVRTFLTAYDAAVEAQKQLIAEAERDPDPPVDDPQGEMSRREYEWMQACGSTSFLPAAMRALMSGHEGGSPGVGGERARDSITVVRARDFAGRSQ